MRLELEQLRATEITNSQENQRLTSEAAKYKKMAEDAEAKTRQGVILRDAVKSELKRTSEEMEKYKQISQALTEKVNMQGETNKNLFRELEASFIDYRKSGVR